MDYGKRELGKSTPENQLSKQLRIGPAKLLLRSIKTVHF